MNIGSISSFVISGSRIFSTGATMAIQFLSPKQAMRTDMFYETFSAVSVKLQRNLSQKLRNITALFWKTHPTQRDVNYLEVLTFLSKGLLADNKLSISAKQFLGELFAQSRVDEWDLLIEGTPLVKQHDALKELFKTFNPKFFNDYKLKLQKLAQIEKIDEIDSLPEHEKLTVEDVGVIIGIPSMKTALENLKSTGIDRVEEMFSRLVELENLVQTPFFVELKRLCVENRPAGTIFLGDRCTVQVFTGQNLDCTYSMMHAAMGRICHIAIFVKPEGKGLHLSHVNLMTKTHGVLPVKNPLTLPFSYNLSLDINPLIPSHIPASTRLKLNAIFNEEFQKIALEEHAELPLAESKQHFKMVLLGHKLFQSQSLESVALPAAGTPIMCSSYVGIVFLRALQRVNQKLADDGFEERIKHPFGEHENLENMDILRLLYLWKQLNLIRPTPLNATLAKVIHSTSILPS